MIRWLDNCGWPDNTPAKGECQSVRIIGRGGGAVKHPGVYAISQTITWERGTRAPRMTTGCCHPGTCGEWNLPGHNHWKEWTFSDGFSFTVMSRERNRWLLCPIWKKCVVLMNGKNERFHPIRMFLSLSSDSGPRAKTSTRALCPFLFVQRHQWALGGRLCSKRGRRLPLLPREEGIFFICGTGLFWTLSFLWMTVLSLLIFQGK